MFAAATHVGLYKNVITHHHVWCNNVQIKHSEVATFE